MKDEGLVPHPLYEGYFESKKDNRIYVSREGGYIFANGEIPQTSLSAGYKTILGGHVHRHIAETFIAFPNDIPYNKLLVNHKNGDKLDNSVSNLEWTNHRGNHIHAMLTGLHKSNHPVWVKDLRTGVFVEYYSLWEAARYFGLNGSEVFHALKPRLRGKVWMKYYGIIRANEEWPEYNLEDVGKVLKGYKRRFVVINTVTGEKLISEGYHWIGEKTGFTKPHLSTKLQRAKEKGESWVEIGDIKFTPSEDYFDDDLDKLPVIERVFTRPDLQGGFRKARKVEVTDLADSSKKVYNSLRECCLSENLSFTGTQKKLANQRFRLAGRRIVKYLDDQASYSEMSSDASIELLEVLLVPVLTTT